MKKLLFSWNYLGKRYCINWAFICIISLVIAFAILVGGDITFGNPRIAGSIFLLMTFFAGIVEWYNLKVMRAERLAQQVLKEQNEQLVIDFTKAVNEYRSIILNNFSSRMGDKEDKRPMENKILELFKKSPVKFRSDFLFLVLRVVGRPSAGRNDGDDRTRLDAWLQRLAYERFDELKKIQH